MYELSDDDKRRIREEEEAAAERDRYRAFVRQQMQPGTSPEAPKRSPKVEYFIPWGRVLAFTIVVVIGFVLIAQYSTMISSTRGTASANPLQKLITETIPIIRPGVVNVKPSQVVSYRISVQENMRGAYLDGKFDAAGGFGNDIEVVVATEAEFKNWLNGHRASLLYSSQKKSAGFFRVALDPGEYRLGLSNSFSLVSEKQVSLGADLNFKRFIAF
ncbi:MAG: hypothetical protein IPJ98_06045 [Bryobacterales bacterium]|nr:hypothetical protein [Bryobacterales bacterium]